MADRVVYVYIIANVYVRQVEMPVLVHVLCVCCEGLISNQQLQRKSDDMETAEPAQDNSLAGLRHLQATSNMLHEQTS